MRGPWKHLFGVEIPKAIQNFPPIAENVVQDFDARIRKRIKAHPHLSVIKMDGVSPQWYVACIRDMANDFGGKMETLQKETSRKFQPSIAKSMQPAYDVCVNERGTSSRETRGEAQSY